MVTLSYIRLVTLGVYYVMYMHMVTPGVPP